MPRHAAAVALVALVFAASPAPAAGPSSKVPPTFEADVRPIFKAYCTECHGEAEKLKGGLDLRLKRFALKGGKNGPALVEGKPGESLLLERVKSGEMPPGKKKLTAAEIDTLKKWIAGGAKVEAPEPEALAAGFAITDDDRRWWALQPVRRPAVPRNLGPNGGASPIDAFLLAKLSGKGLGFNPPADRVALIRRVTLDLTGLPPTPEEVGAFLKAT